MKIKVNGQDKVVELKKDIATITETIKYLGYKPNSIVVELNNLIINSKKWDDETLRDGDKLEIVSIVGGG